MTLQETLSAIPYLPYHEIEVAEQAGGAVTARMPFRREVTNYVGTVHAGALFTLAETAAGVAATNIVPGGGAFVLLRGAEVHYTRRAESELVATARVVAEHAGKARAGVAADGRGDSDVVVEITDAEGERVFEARFDYALRATNK